MNDQTMIESYFKQVYGKHVYFASVVQMFMKAIFSKKQEKHVYIENNRYLRKILKILGLNVITYKEAFETSERFYLLYQALGLLVEKGIPCYIFGRPDLLDIENYSELAQERIRKHLDFPKMSENYHKYVNHFAEILREKNSEEYVEGLKNVPQVIKRGRLFGHDDIKSDYINILNGQRVVVGAVDDKERTIHVYGRCGAFGYAVEDGDNVPSFLQRDLKQKSKYKIRVINHGLWGADDSLILNNLILDLETYGKTDIVVIYERAPLKKEIEQLLKLGVHCFDCTKPFHDDERSRYCFYDRPGHMSAEGYEISSRFIYEMLENTGYQCGKASSDVLQLDRDYIAEYLGRQTSEDFIRNLEQYLENIKKEYPLNINEKKIGAIVMNCNPFTLGHRYLIEYASQKVDRLYIFVLQEDKSFFKFNDRIMLVRQGTNDLKNVIVIPSGEFMISALTFPEYFMKDYKKSIDFDATKDLHTFGRHIAPELGITVRFAGEEPIDIVTCQYNNNMRTLLPEMGVEFHEIPRKTVDGEQVVSASKVRALMKEQSWEEIVQYVPETTYKFLLDKYNNEQH